MERFKKVLLLITASMVVAFFFMYWYWTSIDGIIMDGNFLKQSIEENTQTYHGIYYDRPVDIVVTGNYKKDKEVTIRVTIKEKVDESYRVILGDPNSIGQLSVKIIDKNKQEFTGFYYVGDYFLYNENGEPYVGESVSHVVVNEGPNWKEVGLSYLQLVQLTTGEAVEHRGHWEVFWLITLIAIPFYILDIIFPRLFFTIRYALSVNNPEPTDLYLGVQYISWYLIPVGLFIGYVAGILI